MSGLPFSVLDLVVLGVVIISALLAAVRGFTREVLAIVAWVTAAAAAWFLHPLLIPHLRPYISSDTVRLAASIGIVFIVTLIIVSIITVKISDLILDSRIGALDRTMGFAFGVARGLLLCVIGWAFLGWLVKDRDKMPDWAMTAKTRPMLESTSYALMAMLPDNPEGLLKQIRPPRPEADPAEPPSDVDPRNVPAPPRRS